MRSSKLGGETFKSGFKKKNTKNTREVCLKNEVNAVGRRPTSCIVAGGGEAGSTLVPSRSQRSSGWR
jgi:hypothetical protein